MMWMVFSVVWLWTSPVDVSSGVWYQTFVQNSIHADTCHGRVFEPPDVPCHVCPIPFERHGHLPKILRDKWLLERAHVETPTGCAAKADASLEWAWNRTEHRLVRWKGRVARVWRHSGACMLGVLSSREVWHPGTLMKGAMRHGRRESEVRISKVGGHGARVASSVLLDR